jgi:hypothetical protein
VQIDGDVSGVHPCGALIGGRGELGREFARCPQVIVIAKRHPFPLRGSYSAIASAALAAWLAVADQPDARIVERTHDRPRLGSLAVVDNDNLDVHISLSQHAAQREREQVWAVPRRNHH